MTDALRDWCPTPEDQGPPGLTVYEPSHGPVWVATLPNWRNRVLVGFAVTAAVTIACRGHVLQTRHG